MISFSPQEPELLQKGRTGLVCLLSWKASQYLRLFQAREQHMDRIQGHWRIAPKVALCLAKTAQARNPPNWF